MIQLVGTEFFFHYRKVKVWKKATDGYPYQIPGTGIRTGIDSNMNRTQPEADESLIPSLRSERSVRDLGDNWDWQVKGGYVRGDRRRIGNHCPES